MTNYDPAFVKVTTDEQTMTMLREHATAARLLYDAVDAGAFALENGADAKTMAAFFRKVMDEAVATARTLP